MIVEQKRQLCNKRRVDLNKDNERIDIRPLQARTKKEKREILGININKSANCIAFSFICKHKARRNKIAFGKKQKTERVL